LMGLVVVWIVAEPAHSCGPFFDEAVFTMKKLPEAAPKYMAGRLGVVQASYYPRYLIAAYLWLQGRGLKPEEQAQMLPAAMQDAAAPGNSGSGESGGGQATTRKVPGSQWASYDNCLSDAFVQAEKTHQDRVKRYGADNAEVKDWEAGQAAVFANCSSGSVMPSPAPAGASLWLKQDRAYQMAAAEFYAGDFGKARADFEAIGADGASPWHLLARYVAVRAMVRQATLVADDKPADMALMSEAEVKLRAMLKEPAMEPLRGMMESYMGVVAARAHPAEWGSEMAVRLTGAKQDPRFGQDLTDLLYTLNESNATGGTPASEMVDWVRTVQESGDAHALARWRATHSEAWLVAAMTLAKPSASLPDAAQLAAAALGVKAGSAAYTAVTFQRLRLIGANSGASSAAGQRAEIDKALPGISRTETLSTVNLFLKLRARTAPTLGDFLQDAARVPAGDIGETGEQAASAEVQAGGKVSVCGKDISVADLGDGGRRFDMDGAIVVNQRLPVEAMADAGNSNALPQPLRFETALAAWSRAVLLDQPKVAAKLSEGLVGCQPGMKTWLEKYDQSATAEERHVNGLMALMRFPSVRPYVNEGFGRGDFAAYDSYRDNWWCTDVGTALTVNNYGSSYSYDGQKVPGPTLASTVEFPDPAFIDTAEAAQAKKELESLAKLGTAPDYFAAQALAWVAAHPADERNADLLGFAKRVMRNGCRSKESSQWDHKLFLTMQKRYPESAWAKRYSTWE
jgi:hypothetical protein